MTIDLAIEQTLRNHGKVFNLKRPDIFQPPMNAEATLAIMLSGQIDEIILSPSSQEVVVQHLFGGDVIWSRRTKSCNPSDHSYQTVDDATIAILDEAEFKSVVALDGRLAMLAVQSLARQVDVFRRKVYDIGMLPAKVRIHWYMHCLFRDDPSWRKLASHQQIANELAVSRETVTRELSNMHRAKALERDGDRVRIADPDYLFGILRGHIQYDRYRFEKNSSYPDERTNSLVAVRAKRDFDASEQENRI